MADVVTDALDYGVDDAPEVMEEEEEDTRLKSEVTVGKKQKGRGFKDGADVQRDFGGSYEALEATGGPGPARSVEGWIVLATGIHEEAQEDDVHEAFAEYGEVKNLHLNLDRRTGFVKGYALVEFTTRKEAEAAIAALDGSELLTQKLGGAILDGLTLEAASSARASSDASAAAGSQSGALRHS